VLGAGGRFRRPGARRRPVLRAKEGGDEGVPIPSSPWAEVACGGAPWAQAEAGGGALGSGTVELGVERGWPVAACGKVEGV